MTKLQQSNVSLKCQIIVPLNVQNIPFSPKATLKKENKK